MVLAREHLGSTSLGNGVAIPHPREPIVLRVEQPAIAVFLPDAPDSGKSRGQVARRAYEAGSFHPVFGVRFLELSARDRERIGRFVASRDRVTGGGS